MQWPQRLLTLGMAFRKIVSPFSPNSLMCLRAVGLSQGAPSLPPWSQHLPSIPLDQELFPQIQVTFVRNANKTFPHLLDSRFLFWGLLAKPSGSKPPQEEWGERGRVLGEGRGTPCSWPVLFRTVQRNTSGALSHREMRCL